MHEAKQKLKQITEEILFSRNDFGKQYSACNELYKFFVGLTGVSHSSENADDAGQTILPSGKAISPKEAAHCVLDFARTTQFLRGIHAAILELKKRFPHKKLEILYAGCGPFAALMVPLLTQFTTEDFSLTLIDFHQRSIDAARKIFAELSLENFVANFVRTDASNYKHKEKLHLVICETMQNAMKKEPQSAITLNLAPQLAENGIFVPQKISVEVCLANLSKEFAADGAEKERIYLGEILKLEAEKIRQSSTQNFRFPAITLEIPPMIVEKNVEKPNFMLLTKVLIFGGFKLSERDSAITYPQILNDLRDFSDNNRIEFTYILDKNPRFKYTQI